MITLEINGTKFTGFLNMTVTRSMENIYGSFQFNATYASGTEFPIKRRSSCKVFVNDTPILTGYVEKISVSYGSDAHTVSIEGNDITKDIYQSQLDTVVEFNAPITFEEIIKKTLETIKLPDVKIINEAGELSKFSKGEFVSGRPGETAFGFLDNYARKRQVFLTTDGAGNVIIARGSSKQLQIGAVYNKIGDTETNNILSANAVFDDSERFHNYKCISQSNIAGLSALAGVSDIAYGLTGQGNQNAVHSQEEIEDPEIRESKVLVFNSESSESGEALKERVKWEMNIRRVRSASYNVKLPGSTYDGINPWRVNRLVRVIDEFAGINSIMLIKSFTLDLSLDQGTVTSLELVTPDGYSPQPLPDPNQAKTNTIGTEYTK